MNPRRSLFVAGLFFLVPFLTWPGAARAETMILKGDDVTSIARGMSILEDPQNQWDWADLDSADVAGRFQASNGESPNLGLKHSTFWLKVTVHNAASAGTEHFLVLEYPLMDHIDLALRGPGGFQIERGGDQVVRSGRADWQRTARFPLKIAPGMTDTLYMRVQTEGAVQLPLYIYTAQAYHQWEREQLIWGGTLAGIIVVMLIYSLIYGLALRSLTHLSYVLFLLGAGVFFLTQLGMGLLLFWGPASPMTNPALVLSGGICIIGAGIFFPSYLNARQKLPEFRYAFWCVLFLGIALVLTAFFLPYRVGAILLIVSSPITAIVALLANLVGTMRRYRPAITGLIAWSAGALGFVLVGVKYAGILPANWLIDNSAALGTMLGIVLQALANADRVLFLQREQLRSVEKHKSELETRVIERTQELAAARTLAEAARKESDDLLAKILPVEIANELKRDGSVESLFHDEVSVLFTDFQGFTSMSARMRPDELVSHLDAFFSQFDEICLRNRMEKLKTIGDAYMCASGVPGPSLSHAIDACLTALEMREFIQSTSRLRSEAGLETWQIRIGIHSGPVTSGVIGNYKFAYDIWGDTVNTASRMESHGAPGEVNISEATYSLVKDFFECERRGETQVKGKGLLAMYFLRRIRPELSEQENGLIPNEEFIRRRVDISEGKGLF
ncbi:MAG: hypothetical protein HS115_12465 [Spirochaetales bacterium]|nr:hypothetical protein [Spirochaetales bacterium]